MAIEIQTIGSAIALLGVLGAAVVALVAIWNVVHPPAKKVRAYILYRIASKSYTKEKNQSNGEAKKRKYLYNTLDKSEETLRILKQTNDIKITERAMELREKIRGDLRYKIRFYPPISHQTTDAFSRLVLKQNGLQDLFQFELGNLYRIHGKLAQIKTDSKQELIQKAEKILWEFEKNPDDTEIIRVLMPPTELPDKFYLFGHFKPCLFTWNNIIYDKKSEKKLREYLSKDYEIAWVNKAKITQSDDGSTIRISDDKNVAVITMDKKNEKATLQIGDEVHSLRVEKENDEVKIYKNSLKEGKRWKFPENKFWIMTTGHIKSILRDENTFLAFNLRVLQRCSVLSVVPGLEHSATRGCLFDFTQRLNDTIYLAECNFICEECRSKILNAKKIPEGRRTTFLDELDKWIESTTPEIQKVGAGSSFNIKAINGGT